jgi:aryl-alcohol dehydrogenase-like predicted oxidoreductase
MQGLNNLITAGKVLYLGVSDTPAWIVVKANDYARANGLRPFSVYQGKWNAGFRDMEREIIPMCRDQGMAIAPWAPLGQGKFKSQAARESEEKGSGRAADLSEHDIQVSDALEEVAKRKGTTLHAIVSSSSRHSSGTDLVMAGSIRVVPLHSLTKITGPRIRHAQDPQRLPHHWPTQGRASARKRRGARHHTDSRGP